MNEEKRSIELSTGVMKRQIDSYLVWLSKRS